MVPATALLFVAVAFLGVPFGTSLADEPSPTTGPTSGAFSGIDSSVVELMRKWGVPGGAVAIARDGRIVYARGFGWADVQRKRPVQPESRFRIASISKPLTAATILRLEEQERLRIDDPVVRYLGEIKPLDARAEVDPRLDRITLLHCLQHTAGFDRTARFDPMFFPGELAKLVRPPADPMTIIRFMRGCPLDFDPGERYAYSNFGYCLLGRVIEKVTRKSYEESVRELVLIPAGATGMRLGKTREMGRLPDEVRYYDFPGAKKNRSIFYGVRGEFAAPYGLFYLEAMDAHGGWVGSAPDLLRFVAALEGKGTQPILKHETLNRMIETRVPTTDKNRYYALGWMIAPVGSDANWYHTGSLPGTWTILVRAHDGLSWSALFNTRPEKWESFSGEADRMMWRAVRSVREWPEEIKEAAVSE